MEIEWNKLTFEQRAEFSVWSRERMTALEAKLRAQAAAAAAPKRYDAMTFDEKAAFRGRLGAPMSRLEAEQARADDKRRASV